MAPVSIDVNIDIHLIPGVVVECVEAVVIGGGQSGLAAAHGLVRAGLKPVVPEAPERVGGSWPHCCDSRPLFSAAQLRALPGSGSAGIRLRPPRRSWMTAATAPSSPPAPPIGGRCSLAAPTTSVTWVDGTAKRLDALILATGCRRHWPCLAGLDGALPVLEHAARGRSGCRRGGIPTGRPPGPQLPPALLF
ncbi:NAD(P)-binding protein [Streptomyces avidinii]